jgi:hypothetical protein
LEASSSLNHAVRQSVTQILGTEGIGKEVGSATSRTLQLTILRGRTIRRLRKLRILSGSIIFALLLLAIELPIIWNHVQGVYDFATITQLFPLLLTVGIFLRSWAIYASGTYHTAVEDEPTLQSSSASSDNEMVDAAQFYQGYSPNVYNPYGYNAYGYDPYDDRNLYNYNHNYYNNANWSQGSQDPHWPEGVHISRWR